MVEVGVCRRLAGASRRQACSRTGVPGARGSGSRHPEARRAGAVKHDDGAGRPPRRSPGHVRSRHLRQRDEGHAPGVGGQSLETGPDNGRHSGLLRVPCDLRRCWPAFAKPFRKTFNGDRLTDLAAMPRAVGEGPDDRKHLHGRLSITWVSTSFASRLSANRATRIRTACNGGLACMTRLNRPCAIPTPGAGVGQRGAGRIVPLASRS